MDSKTLAFIFQSSVVEFRDICGISWTKKQGSIVRMGRRRSKRKPPPKNKPVMPLDQLFNCPFCNHEKSCDVKMDRQRNIATIRCQVCVEDYQTSINYLSEAVDVYSDWIDACEQANTWSLNSQDMNADIKCRVWRTLLVKSILIPWSTWFPQFSRYSQHRLSSNRRGTLAT